MRQQTVQVLLPCCQRCCRRRNATVSCDRAKAFSAIPPGPDHFAASRLLQLRQGWDPEAPPGETQRRVLNYRAKICREFIALEQDHFCRSGKRTDAANRL